MLPRVIRTTSIASAASATTLLAGATTTTTITRKIAARTLSRLSRPVAPSPLAPRTSNPSSSSSSSRRAPVATVPIATMSSSSQPSSTTTTSTAAPSTPAHLESSTSGEASQPPPPPVQDQQQQQGKEEGGQPAATTLRPDRALPAPGDAAGDGVTTLDVSGGGSTVKLDGLGPLVVNENGTVSRIGNWAQMTEFEQQNTLRILGKRNQARLAALRAKGEDLDMSGEKNKRDV
ncbi:hypothetical protein HJFPF1_06516 [Paramyrothecium foliicola]|nr:hypothetical protein HJFPF1_06516 [Paramyrothecium foliicola]